MKKLRAMFPRWLHPRRFAEKKVAKAARGTVMAGPFKGMRSLTSPDDFMDYTMLLGTYELELRPIVDEIRRASFRRIIEVGSAQGYYAVGFAMTCPDTQIVAFESNPKATEQLVRTARANGVEDRIVLKEFCDPASLSQALEFPEQSLVFIDIDGGEQELLDPEKVPELKHTHIMLEEHECLVPGITAIIEARFEDTHALERLNQLERTVDDLCIRSPLLDRWLVKLMHERPPGNSWVYMRPIAVPAAKRELHHNQA